MATEFLMPKLGLTMEEGTITEWLVADGDDVAQGAAVLRIETDKTETDVESAGSGRLHMTGDVGDTFACIFSRDTVRTDSFHEGPLFTVYQIISTETANYLTLPQSISSMNSKPIHFAQGIGVMSGTSLDGLDLAYCQFSGSPNDSLKWEIVQAETVAFPAEWMCPDE